MSTTIVPAALADRRSAQGGMLDRIARRVVRSRLAHLRSGQLLVEENGRTMSFGRPDGLSARVRVRHPSAWRDVLTAGTVGAGRSYMAGAWECEDLTSAVRILVRNREALLSLEGGLARLGAAADRVHHLLRRNTRTGSRENIAAHYDLGNDFYELFLDRGMNYSSGWFEDGAVDLDSAAEAKLERICRKLDLSPSDHLLEIGTGWGGLAIHAARHHGCQVTTTTISESQFRYARDRVRAEGLEGRIRLLRSDYRDLQGSYDKIVSVEMVEAVGHQYIRDYFSRCAALLKPGGTFVLQGIVIAEPLHDLALRSVDFIQRYVFPGCYLPSVSTLSKAAGDGGGFRVLHVEDIGLHYALTLRRWRERYLSRLDDVRDMGFPESFIRMWDFYLCYCEGGFLERSTGNVQVVLCKPPA